MFDLPSVRSIDELFTQMEPDGQAAGAFTPALHPHEMTLDDGVLEGEDEEEVGALNRALLGPFRSFAGTGVPSSLAAIDAGVVDLGLTKTGFALAFKAALVTQAPDGTHAVAKIGPRVKLITPQNRAELLLHVGRELMNEEMFVEIHADGHLTIKAGAREPNQFKDRIRNYIERMLQLDATRMLNNGILLIDGSLTLRTYNTPAIFLERLAREAAHRNSDIIGVSKKSRVTVGGVHIGALLDDAPPEAGHRQILAEDAEGTDTAAQDRNLGTPHAVRFAPGGFTFRVDVAKRSLLATEEEVLEAMYANTQMTLGYPNLLRLAHIHSAFTKSEIVSLQVQAARDYGMTMRAPEDLSVIFAPFRKGLGG